MKRTIAAVAVAAVLLGAAGAAPAQASGPPATCDYQRWYPGPEACEGQPWTVSIAQECAEARVANPEWWRRDRVCRALARRAKQSRPAWRAPAWAHRPPRHGI